MLYEIRLQGCKVGRSESPGQVWGNDILRSSEMIGGINSRLLPSELISGILAWWAARCPSLRLQHARHFTAGPELRIGFGAVGLMKLNMKLSRANQMCKA
jgi:hypothetical protein